MIEGAREILDTAVLGNVATVNNDGSPWSTPIHVFSDEDAVYWFSTEDKQHSQNIERDSRVSLTLFSPSTAGGPKGIYINGSVKKLDVDSTTEAKQLMIKKIGKILPTFENSTAYRLPIGTFNGEKSTGNCWYFYT